MGKDLNEERHSILSKVRSGKNSLQEGVIKKWQPKTPS